MRRVTGHYCVRDMLCLILATLIFGCTTLEARVGLPGAAPTGQTGPEPKPTIKQRILEIPPGSTIEVRLLNKQKIRGRLGEVTDEGFSLTTAQGEKISTQKIAFNELKSVKKVEGGKAGHVLLYALAGIGALFVGLIIWAATRSD